ncbi:uncharacterized protein LOC115769454 isoform X2 [Drosophila novamexicana]|uniref:uncharacterized protein LOC115769454 isoform X2 n=1 Tax=Drosophila novamexicana TaxID=47314 RepID=UPI0011E59C09|nr:uncharacterized protein LOC115769454 isoform X2 [Drosophila novamexicana]
MSTLRICKAMSLHPRANIATSDAEQAANASSRICLMGCEASPAELRRFPVHDTSRSQISGSRCSLPHCQKSRRDYPSIKLFKFPVKDPAIFKQWAQICNFSEDFLAKASSLFLCQYHFSPDKIGIRFLKPGSIPDRNLSPGISCTTDENPSNLVKLPPRKRKKPAELCRQCPKKSTMLKIYQNQYLLFRNTAEVRKLRIYELKRENNTLKQKIMQLRGNDILAKMSLNQKGANNLIQNDSD